MLRGEFHKSLPLLLTGQQLSVLRSMCTIPHLCIFLFETGIRLTRYDKFVNGVFSLTCKIQTSKSGLQRLHPEYCKTNLTAEMFQVLETAVKTQSPAKTERLFSLISIHISQTLSFCRKIFFLPLSTKAVP